MRQFDIILLNAMSTGDPVFKILTLISPTTFLAVSSSSIFLFFLLPVSWIGYTILLFLAKQQGKRV
ncbi:MAG: hypothetical protein WBF33_18945 [Candidatus Nitrosopolaris sp.]